MRSRILACLALVPSLLLGLACGDTSGPGIRLEVVPDSIHLIRNDSVRLSVNALDSDGRLVTGVAVSFTSNDTTIATVTNLGVVHSGTTIGRTSVRVSGGGAIADVPVIVTGTPTYIIVAPADTTIATGASAQFRAIVFDETGDTIRGVSVTWLSYDPTLATVTASGLVTAKSRAGMSYIGASYGGRFGEAIIRVAIPGVATQVTVTPADTAIDSGSSAQLTATARDGLGNPVSGSAIAWSSQDTTIATVSSTGLVHSTGGPGRVGIEARSGTVYGFAFVTILDSMIAARTNLSARPQAAAVFGTIAYVSQLDASRVSRANLPSRAFTASVTVGSVPDGLAFSSTGSLLYVANQYSDNVTVVNVATDSVVDVIPTGAGSRPFEVIVAPGDSVLYVAGGGIVNGVRVSTKAIIASFLIPDVGNGVAIARDSLLFVSTHGGGTVIEFNLRTRTVSDTFAVGGTPQKLVVSPNGNELWIANEAGYVQFWDIDTGLQIGTNLTLPSAGYGLAYRSSNGLLYATSAYFGGGYIYVIDPVARTLVHSTIVGGGTRHVAFSADGSVGIVANEGGWVDFLR